MRCDTIRMGKPPREIGRLTWRNEKEAAIEVGSLHVSSTLSGIGTHVVGTRGFGYDIKPEFCI